MKTSTERRHERNRRAFEAWPHPPEMPVLVRRANGKALKTRTLTNAFMSDGGAYVVVDGIPGNTALWRVSLRPKRNAR